MEERNYITAWEISSMSKKDFEKKIKRAKDNIENIGLNSEIDNLTTVSNVQGFTQWFCTIKAYSIVKR